MSDKKDNPSPEKEKEFNDTLKRMLSTPPQPHEKKKKKRS